MYSENASAKGGVCQCGG